MSGNQRKKQPAAELIAREASNAEAAETWVYTVYRDGKWWMIQIPALDGLTQAMSEDAVEDQARDYVATVLDVEPSDVKVARV